MRLSARVIVPLIVAVCCVGARLDPRLTCVKTAGALLLHVMAVVVSLVAAHPTRAKAWRGIASANRDQVTFSALTVMSVTIKRALGFQAFCVVAS